MDTSELYKIITKKYDEVDQISETVIRLIKKIDDKPYAIEYYDVTKSLPETPESLTEYQDQLIGKYYFEGRKSLQWNNYLYFITSSKCLDTKEGKKLKKLIENDRNYARKRIIAEEEIDTLLEIPIYKEVDGPPPQNVLSIWVEHLVKANLDKAILGDHDMPSRLKKIESSAQFLPQKTNSKHAKNKIKSEVFLKSLDLIEYRKYPLSKNHNFGKVNLIFGANGSGKTSLLEAIELLYCGRNKRNPDKRDKYELEAVFADGSKKRVTNSRKLATLRNYNLMWYGQPEVKTNNLYQSFARFNFLDTDAAVGLIETSAQIEDDLSKLLVGPEASKVWRNLNGVFDALVTQRTNLQRTYDQIKEEIKNIGILIDNAKNLKKESDYIKDRLDKILVKAGWAALNMKSEPMIGKLIEELSELKSIIQQASGIDWIKGPLSVKSLREYISNNKTATEEIENDITKMQSFLKKKEKNVVLIEQNKVASENLKLLLKLLSKGVHNYYAEKNYAQDLVDKTSGLLVGLQENALDLLLEKYKNVSLSESHNYTTQAVANAELSLAVAKSEYDKSKNQFDELLVLSQKLRQLANRILESSLNKNECPLCHTHFDNCILVKHINKTMDDPFEALINKLMSNMRARETELHEAMNTEAGCVWLKKFCQRIGMSSDEPVYSVISKVDAIKQDFNKSKIRLEGLDEELLLLSNQGYSIEKLNCLSKELSAIGYQLIENSIDNAKELQGKINERSIELSRDLNKDEKDIQELQSKIEMKHDFTMNSIQDVNKILSELKKRLLFADNLNNKLNNFYPRINWPEEKPFIEVGIDVDMIHQIAAKLQKIITEEDHIKTTYDYTLERKIQLEQKRKELCLKIKRYDETKNTLNYLKKEHALTDAMHLVLKQNRDSVEKIFLHIHAPSDFISLGSSWDKLIRNDESEVKLSEISTGQRSAFALSIFLSQNAQLTSAPPVILMDDPIAYVDDMNTLSFLDYLREIAIRGNRQVFMATANEKLAALFERKFDFLGNKDFRRIDLNRELMPD